MLSLGDMSYPMLRSLVLSSLLLFGLTAAAFGHSESVESHREVDPRLLQAPQIGHCERCFGDSMREDALTRDLGAFVESIASRDWVATRSHLATYRIDLAGRRRRWSAKDLDAQIGQMQSQRVVVVCFERPVWFERPATRGSSIQAPIYALACVEYQVGDQLYSSWVAVRCFLDGDHWRFSAVVPPDAPWQPPALFHTVDVAIEPPPLPLSPN